MQKALNFCLLVYPFYCNLKEKDHIRRKIVKKSICEISIIILIYQKLGLAMPIQQKNKLSLPYDIEIISQRNNSILKIDKKEITEISNIYQINIVEEFLVDHLLQLEVQISNLMTGI